MESTRLITVTNYGKECEYRRKYPLKDNFGYSTFNLFFNYYTH